MAVQIWCNNHF